MRIKIVKKADNMYNLELVGATTGKIMALKNALARYAEQSPVAYDISIALQNAIQQDQELAVNSR